MVLFLCRHFEYEDESKKRSNEKFFWAVLIGHTLIWGIFGLM